MEEVSLAQSREPIHPMNLIVSNRSSGRCGGDGEARWIATCREFRMPLFGHSIGETKLQWHADRSRSGCGASWLPVRISSGSAGWTLLFLYRCCRDASTDLRSTLSVRNETIGKFYGGGRDGPVRQRLQRRRVDQQAGFGESVESTATSHEILDDKTRS